MVQADLEVSALLGRMPSAIWYQPTLSTKMGTLQERVFHQFLGHSSKKTNFGKNRKSPRKYK